MGSEYTQELMGEQSTLPPYPYYDHLRKREKYMPKRYRVPGEKYETIGFGHYLDNEEAYTIQAERLGIKDKENPTLPEAILLNEDDVEVRREELHKRYKGSNPEMLDIMLDTKFQYSIAGFENLYGNALRDDNIKGLQKTLTIEAKKAKAKGMGGNYIRWLEQVMKLQGLADEIKVKGEEKKEKK